MWTALAWWLKLHPEKLGGAFAKMFRINLQASYDQ
jgi:hypothetical protein